MKKNASNAGAGSARRRSRQRSRTQSPAASNGCGVAGPVAMKAVRQLRRQLLSGRLKPGMLLPSVRQLAGGAGIGLVTAYKALHRAEAEGWVKREAEGRRLRVTGNAPGLARSFFEQEPPTVVYWVIPTERRLQTEFRLPGFSEGLQDALPFSSCRYLFLDGSEAGGHLEHLRQEQTRGADVGYVLLSLPARLQRVFKRTDVPCAVLGDVEPELNLPNVYVDQRRAGLMAGGLLCRSGGVVTLCGEQLVGGEPRLITGVGDAARLLGQPIPSASEFYCFLPKDPAQIVERVDALLTSPNQPGGILATRAEFAVATLRVAAQRGLRIPQDLQLVCLAQHPFFDFCLPRVTTIGVSSDQEMGRHCGELLADAFLSRGRNAPTVEIEPVVFERESTLPRRS